MTQFDPPDPLEARLRSLRPPGLSATARARIDARLRRGRLARAWPLAAAAAVIAVGLTALLWRGRQAPGHVPGPHPPMANGGQVVSPPDPGGGPAPEDPLPPRMAEVPQPSSLWSLRAAIGRSEHDLDALLARHAASAPPAHKAVSTPLGRGVELGLFQ